MELSTRRSMDVANGERDLPFCEHSFVLFCFVLWLAMSWIIHVSNKLYTFISLHHWQSFHHAFHPHIPFITHMNNHVISKKRYVLQQRALLRAYAHFLAGLYCLRAMLWYLTHLLLFCISCTQYYWLASDFASSFIIRLSNINSLPFKCCLLMSARSLCAPCSVYPLPNHIIYYVMAPTSHDNNIYYVTAPTSIFIMSRLQRLTTSIPPCILFIVLHRHPIVFGVTLDVLTSNLLQFKSVSSCLQFSKCLFHTGMWLCLIL